MPTERDLKLRVDQYFARRKRERGDVWWFKVHGGPHQRAGVPDYVGCINGRFFALELKSPAYGVARLSPRQAVEVAAIEQAGGQVMVSNRFEEIQSWLDGW